MDIISIQGLFFIVFGTLIVSFLLTLVVRSIAIKLGWISIPRKERWSERKVALMGGISVYVAFSIVYLLLQQFDHLTIWIGGSIMFFTGFFDDRFELKPLVKFLLQFLAASVLIIGDYSLVAGWPFWIAIPLTYLWVIGITNALNLLDNMDGLAAGTAVIIAIIFGSLAFKLDLDHVAVISFILAGAVGGFLILNYNPAKIFMGDAGSLFIGYMMASLPLMFGNDLTEFGSFSVLPIVVAVSIMPIFDTTLVTFLRIFKGRSPSQGGADHTSHRLVFAGLTEKGAVHTLYAISIAFGSIVLIFYPENIQIFYLLLSAGLVGLFYFGLYLSRLNVYGRQEISKIESFIYAIPASFKSRIHLILIFADIVLIIVAFAMAHILRFEVWNAEIEASIIKFIPSVIIIKVLLLAVFGIYKSVWRYAGVSDLIKLFVAVILSSTIIGFVILTWFEPYRYSISVYVIDALLFFTLIAATRFALKALRRLITLSNKGQKRVLLFGAGDSGWLALSEIRQNPKLNSKPIGFIDDSAFMRHGKVQGLKVLGGINDIHQVIQDHQVDELYITTQKLTEEKMEFIKQACEDAGITCKIFNPVFNKISKPDVD